MCTYLFGPFLSLLPASWRANLPFAEAIKWRRAAFVSGALEACASRCALVVWYSYSVTHHTRVLLSLALRAHPDVHPGPERLGLMGFISVALNVVTWVICWFWFEGLVRAFGAAFTGEPGEIIRGLGNYDPQAPLHETQEDGILASIHRALRKRK